MSLDHSVDSSACRRHALRHFRIVSILYCLALLVGTHWPRLEMGGPSGSFDKLMHFFAFGLLVFCFWISSWVSGFMTLLGVGIGVCFLIELTQANLSVGRVYSLHDVEAGVLGVIAFAAMVSSLRPLSGRRCEEIRTLWIRISWSLIARPGPCLIILTSGSIAVLIGGLLAITLDFLILRSRGVEGSNAMAALMMGGLIFGIPAMLLTFRSGFRFEAHRLGVSDQLVLLRGWFRGTVLSSLLPAIGTAAFMLLLLLAFRNLLWNRLIALPFFKDLVFEDQGIFLCLIAFLALALYLRLLLINLARRF